MTTTEGPLALPLPEKSHSETSRSETSDLSPMTAEAAARAGFVDGRPVVDNTGLLGEIAQLMMRTSHDERDSFTNTLGVHLIEVAKAHSLNDHEWGCCNQCGYGDSPWPCADWLMGLTVAVSWLYKRAGLKL